MEMIHDVGNIKVAFFDYDDTVCVHLCMFGKSLQKNYEAACLARDKEFYMDDSSCLPLEPVQMFAKLLKDKGIDCNILTWAGEEDLVPARWEFLNKYYPEIFKELYRAVSREDKVKFLSAFALEHGLKAEEILIVEDHPTTEGECRRAGFKAVSVSELCALF